MVEYIFCLKHKKQVTTNVNNEYHMAHFKCFTYPKTLAQNIPLKLLKNLKHGK